MWKVCSQRSCGRKSVARGVCSRHYDRLKNRGLLPPKRRTQFERFDELVLPSKRRQYNGTVCEEWKGLRTKASYGTVRLPSGRQQYVHRFVYEQRIGPIRRGYVIDHLCRNPPCCNSLHLEAVTRRTNAIRGEKGRLHSTCNRGHRWTTRNTRWVTGSNGYRVRKCRACAKTRERQAYERWYARKKAGQVGVVTKDQTTLRQRRNVQRYVRQ
jgi:hypothetical protein